MKLSVEFRNILFVLLYMVSSLLNAAPMTEFYPLQTGDDYSFSASGGGVTTARVKSTTRIAGTKAVGDTTTNPTNFYFTNDVQGLRIHGLDVPQLGNFNLSPPVVVAPANPIPGTGTVSQNGTVTGTALCGQALDTPTSITISYSASHRIVSAQTNQVIRNEQYPETLTTNFTLSVAGSVPAICGGSFNQQISNETNTYARYFGPVKSVVSLPTLSDTFELVGTNIAIFQLVANSISVDEDDNTATIGVRKFGSFVGNMSVQCFTDPEGATATVGDDYSAKNELIEFSSGTGFSIMPCTVPIVNDKQVEGDETFSVSISNPTSAVAARISGIEDAVVTIVDNDPEGTLSSDFNADGTDDVLFRNTDSGLVATWLMEDSGKISTGFPGGLSTNWETHGTGDFNSDGTADILFRNTETGSVVIWLMSNNVRVGIQSLGSLPTNWDIQGTGDFNADGTTDILWQNVNTGLLAVWRIENGVKVGTSFPGGLPSNWELRGVGDFNADGTADILWQNVNTGLVAAWAIENGAKVGTSFPGGLPSNWAIQDVGDFNADGITDILWRNVNTGLVATWRIENSVKVGTSFPGGLPSNWEIQDTGDFNADGTADILWRNTDTGLVAIWEIDNSVKVGTSFPSGLPSVWEIQ